MVLEHRDPDNHISTIRLIGSLDLVGVGEIETKFAGVCALEKGRLLVDFLGVDFLASTGNCLLVVNARALARRGARMISLIPVPVIKSVPKASGIPSIIPPVERPRIR